MAERHVVLFFSLLAEYQGKCHSCIPLNTNFRHRRQPATPRPTGWEKRKNSSTSLSSNPRPNDLLAGKAISEVHFTRWSGDKVEFWQNL